ncbi:MAG: Fe-S oxidoreductase, partial [Flavobacteriales bacterium]|nr:Fe-S oxidoreductase [Flavobacteriales bacterium]
MSQLIFLLLLSTGIFFFVRRIRFIQKNIRLGRDVDLSDQKVKRWKTMARVALGQGKMTARPVAGIMHIVIYVGFVIINLEMLEILLDGLLGTHRIFAEPLGPVYDVLIGSFEWLAAGVILSCVVFFIRRNGMAIARLRSRELAGWPSLDANIILVVEVLLMFAFLSMNATDGIAQLRGLPHYVNAGSFPVSQWLMPLYAGFSDAGLVAVERGMWWFHIAGVLAFLVYVPYSKHFHIILA